MSRVFVFCKAYIVETFQCQEGEKLSGRAQLQGKSEIGMPVTYRSLSFASCNQCFVFGDIVVAASLLAGFVFPHTISPELVYQFAIYEAVYHMTYTFKPTRTHAMHTNTREIVCPRMYLGF